MDNPDVAYEPFTISLSADEALVLFEYLARRADVPPGEFLHPAERHTLNSVEAQLERALVTLFDARYVDILAAARERLASEKTS